MTNSKKLISKLLSWTQAFCDGPVLPSNSEPNNDLASKTGKLGLDRRLMVPQHNHQRGQAGVLPVTQLAGGRATTRTSF